MSSQMHHRIEVFISGGSVSHQRYARFLTSVLEDVLEDLDLEIIDVDGRPDLAEERVIVAIPQVVRWFPLPIRRIIGEVYDDRTLLTHLELDLEMPSHTPPTSS